MVPTWSNTAASRASTPRGGRETPGRGRPRHRGGVTREGGNAARWSAVMPLTFSEGALMPRKITGEFDIRREAELAVERLVQEYSIDRSAVEVTAAGDDNTAGV